MTGSDDSKQTNVNSRNWGVVTLGDETLFSIGAGGTPSTSEPQFWNGNIPWVTPTDLSNLGTAVISETARTITPEGVANSSAKPLPAGSIVLSTRAPIGYASILGQEMSINQGCKAIVVKDASKVSNEYLYFNLLTQTQKMKELGSGSTFRELSQHNLKSIDVSLPEISEQKNIAFILKIIKEIVIKQNEVVIKNNELKEAMIQQLFLVGTNGEEIKESEAGKFPKSWEITTLNDSDIEIIDGDRGSNYPKNSDFLNNGYCLFLNTKNVTGDRFDFTECKFITQEKDASLRKGKLQREDIILTTRGTVGNVAYYNSDITYDHIRINSGMVILRNKSRNIDTEFLFNYLKSPLFRTQAENQASGSAQPQLPIGTFKRFFIAIPPIEEQKIISEVIKTLDEKSNIERQKESLYQELFDSMLDKLMTGEINVKDVVLN